MSVLVPNLEVYNAIFNKAISYTFNKVCDINYCYTLGKLTENTIKKNILNWLWLNEMSYNRRYREDNEPYLHQLMEFKNAETINTYQMLKYLNCIEYNIELNTIETGHDGMQPKIEIPPDKKESYSILKKAINEIQNVIISEIDEYKNAKYCEA